VRDPECLEHQLVGYGLQFSMYAAALWLHSVQLQALSCICRYVSRSIRFPRQADLGNIKASYDNGVLKLVIPKKQVCSRS
jgi:Hsp20/alpha crystallin family